jgi:hypothetical protein
MGAKFMCAGFVASGAYWIWRFHADEVSVISAITGVVIVTFVAMGAGKIVGILRYRYRHRRKTLPLYARAMRAPPRRLPVRVAFRALRNARAELNTDASQRR